MKKSHITRCLLLYTHRQFHLSVCYHSLNFFVVSCYQVNNGGSTTVAPGAENVGHAQIVSGFSQPFTLEVLFGAADSGAFEERADVQMNADEGEDDSQEPMQEDGSVITFFSYPIHTDKDIPQQ